MKFVYVSDMYRQAWRTYILNTDEMWRQPETDLDELEFLLGAEQESLRKYTRPSSWYLNDLLGENKFVFNMSTYDFPKIEFEYTDGLPSFDDIMMNRAIEMRDMDKEIEILYSGGIDSVAIMYALVEVCPKDQLRIIMGAETPIKIYPAGYKNVAGHLHYEFSNGNMFGIARPDKRLFTTGCEADRLFGSTGYPHGRVYNRDTYTKNKEDDYNAERWWPITRHTYLTQSFRMLQNISVDKMDIRNYQPFFLCPDMLRYAMNMHIDKKIVLHTNWWDDEDNFLKTKMNIRNFISKFDKGYAYSQGKTNMRADVQYEHTLPLSLNFNVLAITEDGTIVNKSNIMDYMKKEALTI